MTENKRVVKTGTKPTVRVRVVRWSLLLFFLSVFALPLLSYVYTDSSIAKAAVEEQTNPRANYWREVREGTEGYSTVVGQETNVLIQNGGQNWRQVRNGLVVSGGAVLLAIIVFSLGVYHVFFGPVKLENKPSGVMILRWSTFERVMHWFVAILFIILAITGLSLLYGRAVLIPVLGREGFAAWAELAKFIHNYLSLLFIAGLAVMLIAWFKENLLTRHDLEWLKQGGGLLKKDKHPHSGRVNAGEKMWFWILFFAGIGLCVSGFYMLFPNFGWERETMQFANIIHASSGIFLVAFSLGHIYMGSVGDEGALEGIVTGEVDEEWAKQHFDLWYQEVVKQGGQTQSQSSSKPQSTSPPDTAG